MNWLNDNAWLLWLAVVLVAGVVEVLTLDFIFVMAAGGALISVLLAALGAPFVVQVLGFALGSALLLLFVRPPLIKLALRTSAATATGVAALPGRQAQAITELTSAGGQVRLAGEVWSARVVPDAPSVEPGATVEVVSIDGATAVVRPVLRDVI